MLWSSYTAVGLLNGVIYLRGILGKYIQSLEMLLLT